MRMTLAILQYSIPEWELESHGIVTDFNITGACPDWVKPEILEKITDLFVLLAGDKKPFKLPRHFKYRSTWRGQVTYLGNDPAQAALFGHIEQNYLRVVP